MTDAFAASLHAWHDFYLLTGTAAATLTGLMFVAASLGTHLITRENLLGARTFVTPTVVHFAAVLVTAAVVAVPTQTRGSLASLLGIGAALGLANAASVAMGMVRVHRKTPVAHEDWTWHLCMPVLVYVLVAISAARVWSGVPHALDALAAAVTLSLVLGIRNAWDLLIWFAQNPPAAQPASASTDSEPADAIGAEPAAGATVGAPADGR